MRYLVTGGLGVVGSQISRRLCEAGNEVFVIDAKEALRNYWIEERLIQFNRTPEGERVFLFSTLEPNGDENRPGCRLEKTDNLGSYLSEWKIDAVIHAAASTGIPHSVLHPDDDWRSNVDATRVLLEALRKHPVPTVVLSSIKPYRVEGLFSDLGRGSDTKVPIGLTEEAVLEPDEPYAASKAAQSMLAMAYAKSYGIPVVTFRCSNLYGPAPCHGPRHGWLTWFCISAAIGRPIEVQGTGKQSRDMLHADDVHAACMLALEHAERLRGRVFNLGGGATNRISVGEAAAELVTMAGAGSINTAPARAMDDDHVFVNTGAFLKETGWRPQVDVRDGMRQVFEWAKANKDELTKLYEGV